MDSFIDIVKCKNCAGLFLDDHDEEEQLYRCNLRPSGNQPGIQPGARRVIYGRTKDGYVYDHLNDRCSYFQETDNKLLFISDAEPDAVKIWNLQEMIDNGVPEIKWIVKDLVVQNGITILGGSSGTRKTWTAMQIAINVHDGTKFLDKFETKRGPVLYIDEENGDITIPNRFNKLILGRDLEENKFKGLFISIFNNFKLDNKMSIGVLDKIIGKYKPVLLVFDSMVRMMEGEEDKSKDVRRIFDNLKPILQQNKDLGVIILHHTTKAVKRGIDALRGSGDFQAFADVILMFEARKSYSSVEIVKNRHVDREKWAKFSIKFDVVDEDNNLKLTYMASDPEAKNDIEACKEHILEWIQENGITNFQSKQVIGPMQAMAHKKGTIYNALTSLIDDQEIVKEKRGEYKVHSMELKKGANCEIEEFVR